MMGLADMPLELSRNVLLRTSRGSKVDRIADLLSVCKLFRSGIHKYSVSYPTQARLDANQPLKLQDYTALKSLVVDLRRTLLITQQFDQSVAVQALTSLTIMLPLQFWEPSQLWESSWLQTVLPF